jgi:phosphate transport system protein
MSRDILDRKIRHLMDGILILESMVETSIVEAVDALKHSDIEKARRVYNADRQVNTRRFELENECMVTIATQQPIMATDLRCLASILEVISELERIGDYAKGIAKICLLIDTQPHIKPIIHLPLMSEICVEMLHQAVGAFASRDVEQARQIPGRDDEVDGLYNFVYRELVEIMIARPETVDQANYLLWAAHNLERMADRVTNICERTIYVVTGQMREIDISDDEIAITGGKLHKEV